MTFPGSGRQARGPTFHWLPSGARDWLAARWRNLRLWPRRGFIRFGSLRRLTPISRNHGYDRGTPLNRVYIEQFLNRHASDVHGRVLEFGDDGYTRRFGCDRVTRSDVMSAEEDSCNATFVGDLASASHLPSNVFDCVVITEVLELVYDLPGALRTLYRILKPGGVVLATMSGLAPIYAADWKWYWLLTPASAERLFKDHFATVGIEIETHGNVLIAIAFLHGVAAEELAPRDFDYTDPFYPVVIAVRAVKPQEETPC
jgi:SAM-dependent methyltransferase